MGRFVLIAVVVAIACTSFVVPVPAGLTSLGFTVLCIAVAMLVLWVSQAVDFAASSFFLLGFMALLGGLAEDPHLAGQPLGAVKGVMLSMQGFATPAWTLVLAALFVAAAVDISGLGRRFGFFLIARLGVTVRRVRVGSFLLIFFSSVFIPSPAAAATLGFVILSSLVALFAIPRTSNLAKGMFMTVGFCPMLSSLMIMTAGGAPVQATSYIFSATGHELTWLAYAMYGFPLTLCLYGALYVIQEYWFPLDGIQLDGDEKKVRQALADCGPLSALEKLVLGVLLLVIPLWITSKVLHPVDNSTIAVIAVAVLFGGAAVLRLPHFVFEDVNAKVPWGTLMLFGSVLSLGQALLESGAAAWVAQETLVRLGVAHWPLWGIIAGGGLVYGVFSLAFSARSAAIGALAPTVIAFAQSIPPERGISVWGMSMVLCYMVQFPVVLPANSPMAMIAFASNSFTTRDMARVGGVLMGAGLLLILLFSHTVWVWMGMM